jgi:putative ATPase
MADGDGRFLFNLVEEIARLPAESPLGPQELARIEQHKAPLYDKAQEGHYNLISALHKSLRGSDTDAALYWLARMLAGGEDPIYILRRLTRAAVEDIGLADPQAVVHALAAWDTYDRLGSPEGELAIAQCVIYLATAPKSNAAYQAFGEASRMARETGSLMPERPDAADARPPLRQGLCLRPRARGGLFRPELFPRRHRSPQLLPTRRAWLRA